ncbi:MAG: cbb3-type cytochrome c oxidase subunit I [Candidatus Kariarchaeaceae archaeon]|jgi:cytochrome c oxidase subunit 1
MDEHGSFWKSPRRIFGTTDAKEISYLYFVLAFINAAISGLYAMLIRLELWTPEGNIFDNGTDYNAAFTLHGTVMVFLVVVPLGAGMGNFLIPRMVAAINADMYWPKWNNVAFWMLPMASIFIWLSQAAVGWTAYTPLSVADANPGVDLWIFGLTISGISSTIGALNFILTIWKGRDPILKWLDLDLFVWGTLITSILLLLTTPSIVIAIVMVFFDRNLNTSFFYDSVQAIPTAPVMYQHLFWFFSHPEVYVMVMPAFGLISLLIAKYSRTQIFGYNGMVGAFIALGVLSFVVWAHHMYTTGINPLVRVAFTTMTFAIAVPSGIKVFNWLTTLYAGRIKFDVPMLFSLSFLIMFTLGGITGVYVNIVPIDITLHDTYWVVGHFHFVVAAGTLQAFFGALYYFFPDMTGKEYHRGAAKVHFWAWSIGNLITFTAFTLLGMNGMPRRYFTYPVEFQGLHQMATVGALLMGVSFIAFLVAVYLGYTKGKVVDDFDNIFDLGSGYDFPTPFAERIKADGGEEIHIEHSLSMRAFSAGWMLTLPFFAFLAFTGTGFFNARLNTKNALYGVLDDFSQPLGFLFTFAFLAWVAYVFIGESKEEKGASVVDQFKDGRNWEIWTFLSSETIFFGILIGVGLSIKANAANWPDPGDVLNVPVTAINTFVLIVSSFWMAKAVERAKLGETDEKWRGLPIGKIWFWILLTIIFGTIFIGVQIYEYIELFHHGEVALIAGAEYPVYSSAFYLQTGFHGFHVFIGLILLTFLMMRARQGGYTKENHEYVEFVGLYWHFVDLVWVFLFTIVYLI